MKDHEFVSWIADRMVHVYGESPNVDFLHRAREVAATIEQQAREIERLSGSHNDASHYAARNEELRAELAALRAQQPGVVLPEWMASSRTFVDRLYSAGWRDSADAQHDGAAGLYDELVSGLNSSPVSAGEPCMCGGSPHTAQCRYEHFLAYSGLSDQPLLRYAYFHGADAECEKPVCAGGVAGGLIKALEQIAAGERIVNRGDNHEVENDMTIDYPGIAIAALDTYRAALTASAQSVPDGWKLVPCQPTDVMVQAVLDSGLYHDESVARPVLIDEYKTMLAAAPKSDQKQSGVRDLLRSLDAPSGVFAAPAPGKGGAE